MAFHLPFQLHKPLYSLRPSEYKIKSRTKADAPNLSKLIETQLGNPLLSKHSTSFGFLFSSSTSSRCTSLRTLSSTTSSAFTEETDAENETALAKADDNEYEFNRVSCLVWVLHESARSFSLAVESLDLEGSNAALAMAWNGKDIHRWHKRIAYQVAVYALLKTAIEVEILLSHDRHNNPSPVSGILTPKINLLGDYIESELNVKHSELVRWFRAVELPHIAGFFIPLLKKWSMEYAGSGVAGIIVAISCCAAVGKLGLGRISNPFFALSIEDVSVELMDLSHSLVAVEKLHQLATVAGFELNFLSHFGTKVLTFNDTEELEFWTGLAQRKLSLAFQKEIVVKGMQNYDLKVQADSLATLGLFAYLGRKTRLFLSRVGMNDVDGLAKDFLNYLECGSLFIYPELASVSAYECFMEVVTDEIGWLEFYPPCFDLGHQERKRSKQHTIQAEKEIILSAVFTVCYDAFSGYAHFSRSTQQPLDAELQTFLLQSQSLLTVCLEDHWTVYDRSREPKNIAETGDSDHMPSVETEGTDNLIVGSEAQKKRTKIILKGCPNAVSLQGTELKKACISAGTEAICSAKSNPVPESLLRKYSLKFVSTSSDVWMGTQLLFVDIMFSSALVMKQLRGHKVSKRERRKIERTLNDIATLIPVTILMLLPVSAVGHAAILAAINKYMPSMIPSPYSSERLDVVKQLKRTKKMEVRSWSNQPRRSIRQEQS